MPSPDISMCFWATSALIVRETVSRLDPTICASTCCVGACGIWSAPSRSLISRSRFRDPSRDIKQEFGVLHGDGALGVRFLVHERHFTEEVPLLHDGQDDLATVLCDQHHLHLTGHDNVERIARVVRKQNNLVPRKPLRLEKTREQFQVSFT